MIIRPSTRLKVLILPFSLVIAVVVAIFFVKPSYSEMMSSRDALASKQTQLETLKEQDQKLQSLESKWGAMADEKNLVATAFPETENVDSYISEITSKASTSGVLLTDISLAQQDSGGADQSPDYICSGDLTGAPVQPDVSSPQPSSADAALPATTSGLPNFPGPSSGCLKPVAISLTATGTWEQMLDFFHYLEDMNRISNIGALSLSTEDQSQAQGQTASNLLSVDISANAFFKEKNQSNNTALASSLASQGDFNQKSLEKLKETIYAPYEAPAVSPGGQRNIFQ